MKDFLDYISGNPLYGVIVIVLFILACKSLIEFYQWVKEILKNWYNTKRNDELEDEAINNEIKQIKEKLDTDYIRIQKAESHLYTSQEEVKEIKQKVEKIENIVLRMDIDDKRKTILSAMSVCNDLNKPVSAEYYKEIFDTYTEYERILEENGMENGRVEMTMTLIKDSWMKRAEAGMFSEQLYLPPAEAKEKLRQSSINHVSWWDKEENRK